MMDTSMDDSMVGPLSSTDRSQRQMSQVIVATLSAIVLFGMVLTASGSGSGNVSPDSNVPNAALLRATTAGETPFTEMIVNRVTALGASSPQTEEPSKGEEDFGECEVLPPVIPAHPVVPTYTASYPGSGDDKLFKLVEAITSMVTGDDFRSNGHKNTVTINTHFPCPEGEEVRDIEVPRTIFLIRNPLDAIAAHFEYMYAENAKAQGQKLSPGQGRAPLEAWEQWRDEYFAGQLQVWHKHTDYWMEIYPTSFNRLVISYENLVDDRKGPDTTMRVAEFLSRADGVGKNIRSSEDLPCLWRKVVSPNTQQASAVYHEQGTTTSGGMTPAHVSGGGKRRLQEANAAAVSAASQSNVSATAPVAEPTYYEGEPPFRVAQLRDVMMVLSQLLEKYRSDRSLAPLLVGYMDDIERRVKKKLERDGRMQFLQVSKMGSQLVDGKNFAGSISSSQKQQLQT